MKNNIKIFKFFCQILHETLLQQVKFNLTMIAYLGFEENKQLYIEMELDYRAFFFYLHPHFE